MGTEKKGATDARRRAVDRYLKEKVETISVRVEKGEKERYRAHAAALGESLNGFCCRALKETAERDGEK